MSEPGLKVSWGANPRKYFWWGATEHAGKLNTIYQPVFHGGNIALPNSHS